MYVDASLITQVFTNLLDNIVKYTPPGTHIQIAAVVDAGADRSRASNVRVTVDDDGPGLPAGDPARLFEKFQRGSGEGTIVGVGLGLAICRAIIRAHGGEIEAHDQARRRQPGSNSPCRPRSRRDAGDAPDPGHRG